MDRLGTNRSFQVLSHKHMHGLPNKHSRFPVCTHNKPCIEVESLNHVTQGAPTILLLSPILRFLRFEWQDTWDKKNNYHRKYLYYPFVIPLDQRG